MFQHDRKRHDGLYNCIGTHQFAPLEPNYFSCIYGRHDNATHGGKAEDHSDPTIVILLKPLLPRRPHPGPRASRLQPTRAPSQVDCESVTSLGRRVCGPTRSPSRPGRTQPQARFGCAGPDDRRYSLALAAVGELVWRVDSLTVYEDKSHKTARIEWGKSAIGGRERTLTSGRDTY